LDVSYNCLGSSNGKVVERLSEFFQKNRSLIHLDLTSNHFNLAQCRIISEAIKLNHSIYGLHFMGNSGYVDSKGFICLDDQLEDNFREIHVQKKINGEHHNYLISQVYSLYRRLARIPRVTPG
jgi:hypothetical protein